ncbi:hypothetical protein [Frigidibacter sp. ROC022]|uniref:hypothetical protein n=1 Tax=Frigidibacter sp. ROC022 TaxID=2971796 RepID=UPI00215AB1FB|nr:hypothetical protein [Frigidibacter sp. ROC022]MCR8722888.1 hypothetical protein [Frigidibacter sp. ROC022]
MKSQILMQMTFGVFALGAFGAVDFMTRKSVGGPEYGFGSYVSEVASRVHFKTEKTKVLRIEDMFPPPPPGWDTHEYVAEDLSRITGKPNEKQQKKVSALQVIGGSAATMATVDKGVYRTYVHDDQTILFKINYIKSSALTGIGGDAVQTMLAMGQASEAEQPFFATVHGLRFNEELGKAYGVARRITAHLGPQISLTLITLEDDATILRLLEGLDVAALNQMLLEPIPGMGEGGISQDLPEGAVPRAEDVAAAADATAPEAEMAEAEPKKGFFSSLFGGRKGASPAKAEPLKIECAIEQGAKRCKVGG